jgi:hypothetical protein
MKKKYERNIYIYIKCEGMKLYYVRKNIKMPREVEMRIIKTIEYG